VHAGEMNYDSYLKLQEALASDDLKTALSAHKTVCVRESINLKNDYKDCGKSFKNIDELRNSFKKLSEVYIKNGDKKMKGLIKASCPMAEAKWIQKEGSLRNPYYGKSMLECGVKI
jgi:hypothetical protein